MEGGVIDMKEESGCDKKDKCVPGKVMLVKKKKKNYIYIKGILRYFMALKVQCIKCWKLI